ncbi:MAG: ribosome silencing factor [Bacteriovoracaceae bacterium]|nr:ribosome silencing factor [Bacteroidota bacterium]
MTSKSLAKVIAHAALSKKAHDVTILDLRKLTTMTDYFVICSVDSDTQARAVADAIKNESLDKGESSVRKEGYSEARWVLLDYVDVVAHVFHKETREFYSLEKLWGDATFEYVNDDPARNVRSRVKADTAQPTKKKSVRKKTAKE